MAPSYITITETFLDGQGNPLAGTATFTPSATVYFSGVPEVTAGVPVQAVITAAGLLKNTSGGPLQLLATDSTGQAIEGMTGFWFWTAAWSFTTGGSGPGFSFSLPKATSSPADLLSLANTPAGGGFTSPMTTLGDTLYENATPAAARLAGNTSAVKNFLTQTGTGSVSAAPAWGTIAVTDIPSLTTTFTFGSSGAAPSAGTYTAGQVLTDQNGIVRVCTTGGAPGTWARVSDQPHQFRPEDYGAKGNGIVCADVTTNATLTVVSPTMGARASVGQFVMIHGANGATGVPYMGTISSISGNNITLSAGNGTPSASVSNCPAVFGTDDTTAINNCITAASTYAQTFSASQPGSGNYMCEILFGDKIYILGSGPTQSGNGTSTVTVNTQIPVPFPAASGATQKLVFKMTGTGAGYTQYWQATTPQVSGTALVSILSVQPNNTPSGATGQQSVVGGPAYGTTSINPGFPSSAGGPGFANVKPVIEGISVWLPILNNIQAWDFSGCCQAYRRQCNSHIFAPTGVVTTGAVQPYLNSLPGNATFKSTISTGYTAPQFQNNADIVDSDCTVQGYECGFRVYDHYRSDSNRAVYVDVAVNQDRNATNLSHLVSISNMDAEAYNGGLQGPQNSGMSHVDIIWSAECTGVAYDVSDPNNTLFGELRFQDSADQSRGITVSGAAHLLVINDEFGPGHMASPPAVPATTVNAALVFRPAWVSVHTGVGVTVSAVTIDGTATGLTMAASSSLAVRVPSGKTISMAYAGGTPTWDWWLD